jgi:hypothetical protein
MRRELAEPTVMNTRTITVVLGLPYRGVAKGVLSIGLLAFALPFAAFSCGGQASPSPNPRADYLRLVAPTNAALDRLGAAVQAQSPDPAKIRTAANDLLNAEVKLNTDLLAFEKEVPSNVQAHVEAARVGLPKEIADLQRAVASTDDSGLGLAIIAFVEDAQADGPAILQLRADLGLPPPAQNSASPTTPPTPPVSLIGTVGHVNHFRGIDVTVVSVDRNYVGGSSAPASSHIVAITILYVNTGDQVFEYNQLNWTIVDQYESAHYARERLEPAQIAPGTRVQFTLTFEVENTARMLAISAAVGANELRIPIS